MKVAAMVWIFVSPAPQIRYWNPNPIVMVLESGAFGRCLGDEDEGVMKGMSALIRETPRAPSHFGRMKTRWEATIN